MRDQNKLSENIRYVRDFRDFHPVEGREVIITWSDMEKTQEKWEEGIYSFNEFEVKAWPWHWSYVNENE